MDQFEAEGRQVRLVNMFNLVREHPLDKKPYGAKIFCLHFIVLIIKPFSKMLKSPMLMRARKRIPVSI